MTMTDEAAAAASVEKAAPALRDFCLGVPWGQHLGEDDPTAVYMFEKYRINRSLVFFWSPLSFAFVNLKPVLPGHVLVSPKRVVERFCDMRKEEICDLFDVAKKVAALVLLKHGYESYTITLQDGAAAGQTVRHVHLHVMPRFAGDFDRSAQQTAAAKSGPHVDADDRKPRQQSEMAEEAAEFRELVRQLPKNVRI